MLMNWPAILARVRYGGNGRFSADAIEAAKAANIRLVDGEELMESVIGKTPPYPNRLAG